MLETAITLHGLDDTRRLATQLSRFDNLPLVIALSGTLGAGKTQLVRFAAESLGVPAEEVTSPTYVLLQMYRGQKTIYHFDFYRLESEAEVWDLGIDEVLEQPALVFVEWAEKFPQCLPADRLQLHLAPVESQDGTCRIAKLRSSGPKSQRVVADIMRD